MLKNIGIQILNSVEKYIIPLFTLVAGYKFHKGQYNMIV